MARLAGVAVFDPNGDQVGRVRDVVVAVRGGRQPPRVLGLVVEVPMRRRIFLPMTRVTALDAGQVITTGVINMRRFEQRSGETLVLGEMFDRKVALVPTAEAATSPAGTEPETVTVVDVAMEQSRTRDWEVTQLFVRRGGGGFRRRGGTVVVDWAEVTGLADAEVNQGAASLLAAYEKMRPADLARALHDLSPKRRGEVAAALEGDPAVDRVITDRDPVAVINFQSRVQAEALQHDIRGRVEPDQTVNRHAG